MNRNRFDFTAGKTENAVLRDWQGEGVGPRQAGIKTAQHAADEAVGDNERC